MSLAYCPYPAKIPPTKPSFNPADACFGFWVSHQQNRKAGLFYGPQSINPSAVKSRLAEAEEPAKKKARKGRGSH